MRAAPVVSLLALLTGCAAGPCPSLAPQLSYCLQPAAAGPQLVSLQQVVVTRGEQSETLLVQIEADGARLIVVGVSPLGQTLVSAAWDGRSVSGQPVPPSLAPGPAAFLALVQLGLLPVDALRPGFPRGTELRIDEAPRDTEIRLQDGAGRTLLAIDRSGPSAPFDRTRIELPTAGIEFRSRVLTPSPSPAAAP
jgi:hypothetical protein